MRESRKILVFISFIFVFISCDELNTGNASESGSTPSSSESGSVAPSLNEPQTYTEACPKCNGQGKISEEYTEKESYTESETYTENVNCSRCTGLGGSVCNYSFINNGVFSSTTYKCDGGRYKAIGGGGINTGLLSGDRCTNCNGNGVIRCSSCNGAGYSKETNTRPVTKTRLVQQVRLVKDNFCDGTGKITKTR
jgi:DnaJ-class molecular chaperone